MPTYLHRADCCNQEFEDFYSIKADPPTLCPLCGAEGQITRLIHPGVGRGIVELTGHELKEKLWADGKKLAQEHASNETKYADFIGNKRYEAQSTIISQAYENLGQVKYRGRKS